MANAVRHSGIDSIGCVSWGAHIAQFHESKSDLLEVVIPYLRAGLESAELCVWVWAEPISEADALAAARSGIPDFDRYHRLGQIEILPRDLWPSGRDGGDPGETLSAWSGRLRLAQERGWEGVRVAGNITPLEIQDWLSLRSFEEQAERANVDVRMLTLCGCPLALSTASDLLDILHNHLRTLIRREGAWTILKCDEPRWTGQERRNSPDRFRALAETTGNVVIRYELVATPGLSYISPTAFECSG